MTSRLFRRTTTRAITWDKTVECGALKAHPWQIALETLWVNGRKIGRRHLKNRLLRATLLLDRCQWCGLTQWLDEKLSLELHHVNGSPDDNRLENLSLLCPNCHSLTPTYCGKNKKRTATICIFA